MSTSYFLTLFQYSSCVLQKHRANSNAVVTLLLMLFCTQFFFNLENIFELDTTCSGYSWVYNWIALLGSFWDSQKTENISACSLCINIFQKKVILKYFCQLIISLLTTGLAIYFHFMICIPYYSAYSSLMKKDGHFRSH